MTDSLVPPPPPKVEGPGLIEDFVDIFVSPAKVFARRATSGAGMAFIAVSIVLGAILFTGKNAMEPIMEAQAKKAIETAAKNSGRPLPQEQVDASLAIQRKLVPVFAVIGAPITILLLAVFAWIVAKVFGSPASYGTSLMITSYAYIPRVIGGIITDVQGLVGDVSRLTNPSQLSVGPARFMDPDSTNAVVLALTTRFDLLTIWVTILIGVGYYAAAKMPKNKAITAAVTMWVLGALFPLWGAIRAM